MNWESRGAALVPPTHLMGGNFWAPEVAERDGNFFMYFSGEAKGSDEFQRLRVAISEKPAGPFIDTGNVLMPDIGFSIDAHPFRDPKDGKWYLFFATDYIEDAPHGTGLAVIPLDDDMVSVVGKSKRVVRATCDWHIYERNRNYKGRVWEKWNCVEGPFVLFHEHKYYCLYSGGAWHTENYGLGFAVADHPLGPWTDDAAVHGPTVLKGVPGKVLGPGHNSVVLGPDNKTLYCVYHAWDLGRTARRMCSDPLFWTPTGPKCDGPSFQPRQIGV